MQTMTTKILRLRIELDQTQPLVWRRIEIPASSTFWDLHVAIQDVFGWLDCHLHQFEIESASVGVHIGGPDEYAGESILEGWTVPLSKYLGQVSVLVYLYDFGDNWRHTIYLEEELVVEGGDHPHCLAGENATPPEDCGGAYGYEALKKTLVGPKNAQYFEVRSWLQEEHAKVYWPFNPTNFDPSEVQFTNAKLRLKRYLKNT